jgi:DNA-binding GntR family transcriptional regulator
MEAKQTGKRKRIKHVLVYDQLYESIRRGVYPAGSQLPSESELSEKMNVSRMTLRKALLLLEEDGIIRSVPGVGHFVCQGEENSHAGNSPLTHPVYAYCTEKCDDVQMEFRIEPPTPAITDALQHYSAAVVIADRWYRAKKRYIAYSLSYIPIDVISEEHIDLNDREQLKSFLEKGCYEKMKRHTLAITGSKAGNFTASKHHLSEDNLFLLITEHIYDEKGTVIVTSKHYIPYDLFLLEIEH